MNNIYTTLPALLRPDELKQLTGKTKSKEQAIILNKMGIEYKRRISDKEILVSRLHFEKAFDGLPQTMAKKKKEPNYGALM